MQKGEVRGRTKQEKELRKNLPKSRKPTSIFKKNVEFKNRKGAEDKFRKVQEGYEQLQEEKCF